MDCLEPTRSTSLIPARLKEFAESVFKRYFGFGLFAVLLFWLCMWLRPDSNSVDDADGLSFTDEACRPRGLSARDTHRIWGFQ